MACEIRVDAVQLIDALAASLTTFRHHGSKAERKLAIDVQEYVRPRFHSAYVNTKWTECDNEPSKTHQCTITDWKELRLDILRNVSTLIELLWEMRALQEDIHVEQAPTRRKMARIDTTTHIPLQLPCCGA